MLRIYTAFSASQFNAQKFYRLAQPAKFLQALDLAQVYFDFGEIGQSASRPNAENLSSIHWLHQITNDGPQRAVEFFAQQPARWLPAPEGTEPEWDAPPSIVLDTDDDFFNAMPFHAATYRWCGTRDLEGNVLEAGQGIAWEDPATGTGGTLFLDGKDGFDLAANKATMAQWRTNLALAAIVTCSTPVVERAVKREVSNANTLVVPNCINFDDYPELPEFVDDGKIRILWQGGDGHEQCLKEVRDVLQKLHDEFENVEFLFWGGSQAEGVIDSPRWKRLPWCNYYEFKLRLNGLGHDINLCPLYKHPFNDARSAIKWYESSACSKPAATLAANYAAFGAEIEDGVTGLLYDTIEEFEDKLRKLILDADLRKRLASNAKEWVRANRDPAIWAERLASELERLRAVKKGLWKAPIALAEAKDVPAEHTDIREREGSCSG